jgi:hypothetical protein
MPFSLQHLYDIGITIKLADTLPVISVIIPLL